MRKEKELDSKVKKPAEAEKYRTEKKAEAYAIEVKAKAEAEQVVVEQICAPLKSGILLLLTTLNMQMAKKADAWQEYKEAALVDMMLKVYFFYRTAADNSKSQISDN